MRISFDIDDTLVLHTTKGVPESGRFPAFIQRHCCESLRFGTCGLFRKLRRRGCSIWIYTSSLRTPFGIRWWLFLHGLRVDGVVNDDRHFREVSGRPLSRLPSKYPPAFGIDLHVDDSEGVRMEAAEHGFRVVIIRPDDVRWTEKVLEAVTQHRTGRELAGATDARQLML